VREHLAAAAEIAPRASAADHVRLFQIQLLLPDLVAAVEKVIVESGSDDATRSMAGGLVTYVCNPLDVIGDERPLGRVDDSLVCAMGLRRLEKAHRIVLEPHVSAMCDVVLGCLGCLGEEIQESLKEFVADLDRSTKGTEKG
jgi:hypothetical protein